jgi:hypothetical protein
MALVIEEVARHDEEKVQEGFTFHFMPEAVVPTVMKQENAEKLTQWGLLPDMQIVKFRYEEALQKSDLQTFVQSFFKSKDVCGYMRSFGAGIISPGKIKPRYEELLNKQITMQVIRQLETEGLVGRTGKICGRLEEDCEGVPLWDMVREALLLEESEHYPVLSEDDRKEFLVHIFKHIVVGGALNQYEEYLQPYLDMTKSFYKDLACVRKNDAGDMEVLSWFIQVTDLGEGGELFPHKDMEHNNFCYLVVDPVVRHVTLWYFPYRSVWKR